MKLLTCLLVSTLFLGSLSFATEEYSSSACRAFKWDKHGLPPTNAMTTADGIRLSEKEMNLIREKVAALGQENLTSLCGGIISPNTAMVQAKKAAEACVVGCPSIKNTAYKKTVNAFVDEYCKDQCNSLAPTFMGYMAGYTAADEACHLNHAQKNTPEMRPDGTRQQKSFIAPNYREPTEKNEPVEGSR